MRQPQKHISPSHATPIGGAFAEQDVEDDGRQYEDLLMLLGVSQRC